MKSFFNKFGIVKELFQFFWQKKLWWLIPMMVLLLLFAVLIILGQSSPIAPFIYTLF